jgi:hypothetical protein
MITIKKYHKKKTQNVCVRQNSGDTMKDKCLALMILFVLQLASDVEVLPKLQCPTYPTPRKIPHEGKYNK